MNAYAKILIRMHIYSPNCVFRFHIRLMGAITFLNLLLDGPMNGANRPDDVILIYKFPLLTISVSRVRGGEN